MTRSPSYRSTLPLFSFPAFPAEKSEFRTDLRERFKLFTPRSPSYMGAITWKFFSFDFRAEAILEISSRT
ncbi:MAG: hypothetical protein BWY99_02658 [Synergistetes bacterium ADurb.BinA166]|nr:MAG: hypothetical protein BWY99_02658 [Synergistetes bacterium ADurb.BinA166]